jgi:hypothetical protein
MQPSGPLSGPRTKRPGTAPTAWPPAAAGGAGTCVRSEKGLFVVVIVGAVVMLLGDSPLAPPPYPATMTATAAPLNNVIAALPLLFVII